MTYLAWMIFAFFQTAFIATPVTVKAITKPVNCVNGTAHTVTFTYSVTYTTPGGAITAASATPVCTK